MQKRVTVITGHYGSGKTNLAVNLAVQALDAGQDVALCDLDIVNPYFRSADFGAELSARGVRMILPAYAGSNLDLPALTAQLDGELSSGTGQLILDVGGDDAGAIALGRYAAKIRAAGYEMLYVFSAYRGLTRTPDEALLLLRQIEAVSRLEATALVNNSNLSYSTTAQDLIDTVQYAQSLSEMSGLPLRFTCVPEGIAGDPALADLTNPLPVKRYVRLQWEAD